MQTGFVLGGNQDEGRGGPSAASADVSLFRFVLFCEPLALPCGRNRLLVTWQLCLRCQAVRYLIPG
jgi:hypothetical protein